MAGEEAIRVAQTIVGGSGAEEFQLLVFIGKRAIAVLPDRDVDLGDVNLEGNAIFYEKNRMTGRIEVTVGAVPPAS